MARAAESAANAEAERKVRRGWFDGAEAVAVAIAGKARVGRSRGGEQTGGCWDVNVVTRRDGAAAKAGRIGSIAAAGVAMSVLLQLEKNGASLKRKLISHRVALHVRELAARFKSHGRAGGADRDH